MTSTIWSLARCVYTQTEPPVSRRIVAPLATTSPAEWFNVDEPGRADPHGNNVTNPRPDGEIAVTFTTAAFTSNGTPARPAARTVVT